MTNNNRPSQDERRAHHAVREIFAQACVLLAPFVNGSDKTFKMSGFALMHMVQGHFPALSSSEAHIVIIAVERLHRENQL